jgi:hypothetical protein
MIFPLPLVPPHATSTITLIGASQTNTKWSEWNNMAKQKPAADDAPEPENKRGSIMGYFRTIFDENPKWLHERSNDKVTARWLQDNPSYAEMPKNVKNTLANLKSNLRKKTRSGGRKAKTEEAANGGEVVAVKAKVKGLETLEIQIDECLTMARNIDRDALQEVIRLLRRARNEVVWKSGM